MRLYAKSLIRLIIDLLLLVFRGIIDSLLAKLQLTISPHKLKGFDKALMLLAHFDLWFWLSHY